MSDSENAAEMPPRGSGPPRVAGILGKVVDRLSFLVQAIALSALTVLVVAAIIARYVFHDALLYEDDLITLLFIWAIFGGIGRATWHGDLLKVGIWARVSGHGGQFIDGITAGSTLCFYIVLIASQVSNAGSDLQTQIPTLGISVIYESVALTVGPILGICAVLALLLARRSGVTGYATAGVVALVGCLWVFLGQPSGAWILLVMLVMILLDVPLATAIGLAGSVMAVDGSAILNITQIVGQEIDSVSNVAFIALPLFMILGGLVAQTGLARELGNFLRMIFQRLPGGVGVACVGAAGVLANMTGSPLADTAALGSVFIPELRKSGYSKAEAGALQACAGLLGMVFPPAVVLIIWATLVNVSVTAQFLAVIVPGILLGLVMAGVVVLKGLMSMHRRIRDPRDRVTARSLTRAFGGAVPVMLIPAILDGGIFSGVFAAYEAGSIAIVAAGGIGAARRYVKWRHVPGTLEQAGDTTSMVMLILGSLGILKYGLFTSGVETEVGNLLTSLIGSTLSFWIVVNIAFMILHEFVEPTPAILLLAPFIVPLATSLHISLLQLGVVIVINSTIGLVLPPLGVNLYLAAKLADSPANEVLKRVWPYLLGSVGVLGVACGVPELISLI